MKKPFDKQVRIRYKMDYKDMNEDQKAKFDQQYEQKLQKKKQEAEVRMTEFDNLS